jgi:hypothetical protein
MLRNEELHEQSGLEVLIDFYLLKFFFQFTVRIVDR